MMRARRPAADRTLAERRWRRGGDDFRPGALRNNDRSHYFRSDSLGSNYFFFATPTAEIGALDLARASLCCLSVDACCLERSFDFGDLSPMHITPHPVGW